jgi:hypothetical protein
MNMKKVILRVCLLLAILAAQSASLHAQLNAFTYQGNLKTGGTAVSGLYDFEFDICDAPSGGNILTTQARIGVSVTNGIFTVNLNASPTIFSGAARYLEIRVKPSGGTVFDTLEPRQLITSAPYALKSFNSTNAEFATNSQNALNATNATNATNAQTATSAGFAMNAQTAITATTATTALNSNNLGGFAASEYQRFKWTVINSEQQLESNNGYIINADFGTLVTLPDTPQVGDVIRVMQAGSGNFQIILTAGRTIVRAADDSNFWRTINVTANFQAIASSADGSKLTAVSHLGNIYTSADSGNIWTVRLSGIWNSVASSADGTKLIVAGGDPRPFGSAGFSQNIKNGDTPNPLVGEGKIYTSSDSGATWTDRLILQFWTGVASSADGTKLAAVARNRQIYISNDSGATWTLRGTSQNYTGIASSADGSKLAAVADGGQIYTSADSGVTWTARESNRRWSAVASSADGTLLAATEYGGRIYTSGNSGQVWDIKETTRNWSSVAMSADGLKIAAVENFGQIYTSTDFGLSWKGMENSRRWNGVASSADGTKLAGVESGGKIYLNQKISSTLGLTGTSLSSVELVYIGGGKFLLTASKGNVSLF